MCRSSAKSFERGEQVTPEKSPMRQRTREGCPETWDTGDTRYLHLNLVLPWLGGASSTRAGSRWVHTLGSGPNPNALLWRGQSEKGRGSSLYPVSRTF